MKKKVGFVLGFVIIMAVMSFVAGNVLAGGSKNSWRLLLDVLGGGLLGVAMVYLLLILSKESKEELRYDERQIAARGKAFQYGFFTLLVYNLLYFVCDLCEVSIPMQPAMVSMIGAFLGALVMSSYCVWKDAYWQLNQRRGGLMCLFILIGVIDVVTGIRVCMRGDAVVDGVVSNDIAPLIAGAAFLLFGLVFAAKAVQEKLEDRS